MSSIKIGDKEVKFKEALREHLKELELVEEKLKPLLKCRDVIFTKLKTLGSKYGKDYIRNIPEKHVNTMDQLDNIFNKEFLQRYVMEMDTFTANPVTYEDIQKNPWVCNFPSSLTSRQRNYKENGVAPCTRSLGLTKEFPNVYFCSVPKHIAYARSLDLPINTLDLKRMNLPIPPFPTDMESIKRIHVRTKLRLNGETVIVNRPEKQGSSIDPNAPRIKRKITLVSESSQRSSTPTSSKRNGKKCKKITDGEPVVANVEELGEISRIACVYTCPITGKPCSNDGVFNDPFECKEVSFCNEHVKVPEELLSSLGKLDVEDDETGTLGYLSQHLQDIQSLDHEIKKMMAVDLVDVNFIDLCRKRYNLASKSGLGTRSEIISVFHNPSQTKTTKSLSMG